MRKIAKERIQEACGRLLISTPERDSMINRFKRLVDRLEQGAQRNRGLCKANDKAAKYALKNRLGLLIARNCPTAFLNPEQVETPALSYRELRTGLESLEESFETRLGFTPY